MKRRLAFLGLLAALVLPSFVADRLSGTVTHDLAVARPSEKITVPWAKISDAIPGALLQHLAVKAPSGRSLPCQVTNITPQAKDPTGKGIAYGDLIFQHDFAPGEKSATFTIEKLAAVAPVFPTRAFARYVAERLDDFTCENNKIAHRTYGPALAAPAAPGVTKEVLDTSGLDIWCKRVSYPIVDRWSNEGHDHYPKDQGEGMDRDQVGPSRGCGGTGIKDGTELAVSQNYTTWQIIANGPVCAVFELTYAAWDAHGLKVTETKRFTVAAGHNLDRIESTFTVTAGSISALSVAIGLNKTPGDKNQDAQVELTPTAAQGSLTQWILQKTNGQLGTAVIVPAASFQGFAADDRNDLILAKATAGQPLRYYARAGWSKAGEFTTKEKRDASIAAASARITSPFNVTLAAN